ncbi:MAG: hypothetical protein M1455_04055 [Actinobacteria bacterium]|nr:hypothetical protein [Actinomycetota bacterium]
MSALVELLKKNILPYISEVRAGGEGQGGSRRRGVIDGGGVRRHHACGVCGRTLLTGESLEVYSDPGSDQSLVVCSVCRQEARENGFRLVA